jgi:hypothetical protein
MSGYTNGQIFISVSDITDTDTSAIASALCDDTFHRTEVGDSLGSEMATGSLTFFIAS